VRLSTHAYVEAYIAFCDPQIELHSAVTGRRRTAIASLATVPA
jgi:hypothetical protein